MDDEKERPDSAAATARGPKEELHEHTEYRRPEPKGQPGNGGEDLAPDLDETIKHLNILHPNDLRVLSAIHPESKGIETVTFRPDQVAETRAWIERNNVARKWGIYVNINPVIRAMNDKAKKVHTRGMARLHADVDPRVNEDFAAERLRILDRLRAYDPPPSYIIDSGGGYWGLWSLSEELRTDGDEQKAEDLEGYNRKIEQDIGADLCFNIDRVGRLVGTINWPNEKKGKRGQKPALARFVDEHPTRIYAESAFKKAPPKADGGGIGRGHDRPGSAGIGPLPQVDLEKIIPVSWDDGEAWKMRAAMLCVQGDDPDYPIGSPRGKRSRSEIMFAAVCALLKMGIPDDVICSILLDPDFRLSDHVREQKSPKKYALRQIERAQAAVARHAASASGDPTAIALHDMNDLHAVIKNYGNHVRVMTERAGEQPFFQEFADFNRIYMNKPIQVGVDKGGAPILVPRGKWWLSHVQRREYLRAEFLPGQDAPDEIFNLWCGFPVIPVKGECDLFLGFLLDIICCGDSSYSEWLLDWMAHAVQRPEEPGEVAVVLRGGMGIGKGFYTKHFGELFGRHFIPVTDPKHVVGNFNHMLLYALLIFADEAFAANDKRAEGILKGLITEEHITIEPKGVDSFKARKYLRLILGSNNSWVVPADADDRRFFVLDVSEARKRDTVYFGALDAEWKNGGREALMYFLLNRDISRFNHRLRPETAALTDQKILTLRGARKIIYDTLAAGDAPVALADGGRIFVATNDLWKETEKKVSQSALGRELGAISENEEGKAIRLQCGTERKKGFWLPRLSEARRRWCEAKELKQVRWPQDDGEWITSDNEARGDDDGDPPF